jgi:hypothetical protein
MKLRAPQALRDNTEVIHLGLSALSSTPQIAAMLRMI